ncbi:hypothetical protein PFBG_05144 [Plasmodium falciparum 7G8]|uniref:MI domain-containing protein n=1 Tax=Plasmodium falciparum (isolate 7G8) TaxID=57266 RepID=W7F8I6_PLAF8|nr:hypothetical protein PFBG_05144 [Plasmodium falciparum 7G8]
MEKFLMSSLNKTSEFNIKSIIDDICKYFHDIDNVKLKLCYNDILIKQISTYFKNVNTTDIHICMCVVIICVLNNLLCENILYDFLKDLTAIFKYYYEDNVNLMKIVERENEMNNKIETQSINSVNDTYLLNRKNENNMLSNPQGDNYKISPKEHEKYQDFKILFRNLLKCFSLFYALSYIEFDFIIDIINILCEHMSINNVDNIIIVLKICGMKLKEEDDNIHLKHISEYLKKQIEQYIECNNILLEKSKLRFLIKDIEDLENGKMKFHFLNKFEFLFSVLKEYENKYVYKKTMISFSFIKVFNTISVENMHDEKKRGKQKNKNKNKNICNDLHTNISNNQFHDIENKTKINKLNYLIDQEQFNEVHFNKLLKKYKIQGILPKKIFLIIKYSLDVDECVHNLLALLKKKKNIPHVIQTIIQIILYNKNYKESYAKLLSNLSHVNNRVYTFSLKTIFINYIKNISNMDIKNVLFLSKLFTYLLKEKLINFLIFKHIKIEEMKNQEKTNDEINQDDTNANSNIFFFLKTIFILISLDDHKENKLKNKNVWTNILHILYNQKLSHNLSRKEIRKLARKQIKKNKLLYSKKKRKNSFLKKEKKQVSFSNNDQIIINKNHESNTNQFLSDSDKNLIKKNKSVKNSKKTKKIKLNDNSNKSFNYFNNKRNYLEEQEKDDYLLSYLSKKLKIKNEDGSNKKNEDKLIKELEKDGFDTSLLKLADIIFNESQNFLTKKKIQKGKDDEYNEDGEYNEDDEYNEDGEYNEDDEYNVDDEYNEDDEYNVDDEYNENDEYNEDGEDNLSQDNDKVNNKNVDNILSGKENEQPYNKLQDDNIDNYNSSNCILLYLSTFGNKIFFFINDLNL